MAPMSTAALVRKLLDYAHARNHEAGPDGRGVPPFDREDPELHLRCVLVRGIRVSTNVGALVRAFPCACEISSEAIEGLQRVAIVVFARAADAKKALEIPTRRVGFGTGICEAVSREVIEESKNGLGDGTRPRLRLLRASQFRAELEALIRNTLAKVADASAIAQAMDEQDEQEVVDDATKKQVPDEQNEEAVVVDATKKPVPDEQDEEAEVVDYATKKPVQDEQDEEAKAVGDATKKQVPDEQNEEAVVVDATKKPVPDEQDEEAEAVDDAIKKPVTDEQEEEEKAVGDGNKKQVPDEQNEEAVVVDATKKPVPDEQDEEAKAVGDATKKQVPDEQNVVVDEENKQNNTCATLRCPLAMEEASATLRRALGIAMPKSSEAEATKPPQAAAFSPSRTDASSVPVAAETARARPSAPASGSDATWSVPPTGAAGATALRKPQEAKISGVRDGAVTQQPRETPHSGHPQGTPALTAETQQQLARCFELIQRAVQLLEKCNLQQGRSGIGQIIESV